MRTIQCITPSGLHRVAYHEWGDRGNPRVLLCVHGLGRTGRDFAYPAARLARHYRVIAPDMPGRGDSDWLANPMEYQIPTYVADAVTLIARLDVESVDWLGTSMGGLIGMGLAALPGNPIRRLVLNDVGPVVTAAALARIGLNFGKAPRFADFAAAEAYVRMVSATFGPHTDAQWRTLTENVVRRDPDGLWRMHYDPKIALATQATPVTGDIVLWPMYEAIQAPTLVLRGAQSDLLTHETAVAMTARGPRATLVEFAGVGHAPSLLHDAQIDPIEAFLLA